MDEKLNCRKAVIFSVVFHLIAFACLSGLITAKVPPKEELLEMALIDDLSLYGQTGSATPKGDGTPVMENITLPNPQATQNNKTEIKQPEKPVEKVTAEMKPINENIPSETVTAAQNTSAKTGNSLQGNNSGGAANGTPAGSNSNSGSGSGNSGGSGGGISPPAVLSSVKPSYPSDAWEKSIEGIVIIRALILENGLVGEAVVVYSSGNASLGAAAVTAIYKWRFVPAKNLDTGTPLARYTRVPVSFSLK